MGLIQKLRLAKRGSALVDALHDGAEDWNVREAAGTLPEALYRQPRYWRRVLTAAAAFYDVLPLPLQGRSIVKNALPKIGMVVGAIVSIAGTVQTLPGLPPKYQGLAGVVGTFAAMLAGLLHPAPSA